MVIPLTLELNTAPGCQPSIFVRHAPDSPWVESRMDVLVAAVSVVAKQFLPIVSEAPTPAYQRWPIPFT